MLIEELIHNVVLNQICTRQTHLHTYPQVYDPIVQTSVLVNTTLWAILSGGWGGEGRGRDRGEGGREMYKGERRGREGDQLLPFG